MAKGAPPAPAASDGTNGTEGTVTNAEPKLRRAFSRTSTFRQQLAEQLDSMRDDMLQRLEPMLEAAGDAAEGMSMLLDPAKQMELLDEALAEPRVNASAEERAADTVRVAQEASAEVDTLQHMRDALIDPHKIMIKDKMAFVFGVVNVVLTAFWVGRWPETYHWFWMVKDVVLFTLRYLTYKQKGMHYMMLEYCYAANFVAFYYLFNSPQSAMLRRFSFAIMTGPLMWSIVAMRNSLVFHDGDKITTLMMHASPALTAWCMRWYPQASWTAGMSKAEVADWNSATWAQMALMPAVLNIVWVSSYYLFIFVVVNKRIQERGYQNMFTAMVMRPSARKSPLARLVLSAPESLRPLMYLGLHTTASWLSLLPTKLWYDNFIAHTAILSCILLWATWNGASFYFRVFAKKMMQEEIKKQEAAARKQLQAAAVNHLAAVAAAAAGSKKVS
ncbi:hypothetical protein D9Q98_005013 [Chlorella vulgaris]|uniref:Glycerophosphocholine acyltransferase 1 n=1 Tax=Chlorella vulgaris TaxID=3077 RepID=A0A9D4TNA3_CHLVU|nr:hypothetical protein D9Q98_005013 [Chlorella vulgaris]